MCERCAQILEATKPYIDAVDSYRGKITELMLSLHASMAQPLVQFVGELAEQPKFRQQHVESVLMLNYLAGFMVGDALPSEGFDQALQKIFEEGMRQGQAYACVRQSRNN